MADLPAGALAARRRWTQTAITELRNRLLAGESVADIATGLDRTPDDVTTMMSRMRLRG